MDKQVKIVLEDIKSQSPTKPKKEPNDKDEGNSDSEMLLADDIKQEKDDHSDDATETNTAAKSKKKKTPAKKAAAGSGTPSSRPKRSCAGKANKSLAEDPLSSGEEEPAKPAKKGQKKKVTKGSDDDYSDNEAEVAPKKSVKKRGRASVDNAKGKKNSMSNGLNGADVDIKEEPGIKPKKRKVSKPDSADGSDNEEENEEDEEENEDEEDDDDDDEDYEESDNENNKQDGGQAGAVRYDKSDNNRRIDLVSDLNKDELKAVTIANNMNKREAMELQILYVNIDEGVNQLNALVGWSVKNENRLIFQCMFCAQIDMKAKGIANHMKEAHGSFMFTMVKKAPPSTKLLFFHCLRCDYVCIDVLCMWLHYGYDHGLENIVESKKKIAIDLEGCDKTVLSLPALADVFPFYKCTSCDFIAVDSKVVADHVMQKHDIGDLSSDFNGCWVRILKLSKPNNHDASHTYADVYAMFKNGNLAGIQTEMYLCVFCLYVSFNRLLALTHHCRMHTGKHMMLKCSREGCAERCLTAYEMIQHIQGEHDKDKKGYRRMQCQVTVLEKKGEDLVEAFSF